MLANLVFWRLMLFYTHVLLLLQPSVLWLSIAIFFKQYSTAYHSCFPLKKTKASNYRLRKPWLSKGLLKSIRTKNKLYRQYLTNQSLHYEIRYKNYKNKLNHSLRIAKRYLSLDRKGIVFQCKYA